MEVKFSIYLNRRVFVISIANSHFGNVKVDIHEDKIRNFQTDRRGPTIKGYNFVDPDQTSDNVASGQILLCLPLIQQF